MDEITSLLSLTEWRKKKDILERISCKNERRFRKLVEQNNKMFAEGKVDYYIAHSFRGYKLTFNWEEIKKSVSDNRKRAITMLQDCSNVEKAFQKRNQIKMDEVNG